MFTKIAIGLGRQELCVLGHYKAVDIEDQNWTRILEGKISALIIKLGYNLVAVNYIICAQLPYLQTRIITLLKNCQNINSC